MLLVNTFERGGAANACLRLHSGLLRAGVDSKVLLREKYKEIPQTFIIQPQQKKIFNNQRLCKKIRTFLKLFGITYKSIEDFKLSFFKNRDKRLEYFSFPDSSFDITASKLYKEADIINLHWVAEFLDYGSFFKKNTKPVIWTLHDMNPFSGGEHYEEEYLGMDENGYPIPRVITKIEKRLYNKIIALKFKALEGVNNLHIVTLCTWMTEEVKKSKVLRNFPVHLIPNGIDSTVFKQRDKEESRNRLNLPQGKKVILFVADSVDKDRKGFSFLKKAFEIIDNKDIWLCSIGGQAQQILNSNQYLSLGTLNDEVAMSYAYSAADVFVIPSLMDNLPNTVLESLMCGTPVIGFPVGGIVDMVQHGKNGYITEEINALSLLKTLQLFLAEGEKFNNREIRNNALEKYNQNIQADNYLKLYKSILNK